jgi:hypothetical protein
VRGFPAPVAAFQALNGVSSLPVKAQRAAPAPCQQRGLSDEKSKAR